MERGYEVIELKNGEAKKVRGLLSKNFLLHKTEDGGGHLKGSGWALTHRATGLLVRTFALQKVAREVIRRFEKESFPVPWEDVTTDNAGRNYDLANDIMAEVGYKL